MKIQEAAVKIISQWENKGRYNVSANQTYGLLGWTGAKLERLLMTYNLYRNSELEKAPEWYAKILMMGRSMNFTEDFIEAKTQLDVAANDPIMRKVQDQLAKADMDLAIITAHKWYANFESPLSQLILCDMAVMTGRHDHNYVVTCGAFPDSDEETVLVATMKRRMRMLKYYGIWDCDPQLRDRCNFYLSRVTSHKDWDLSGLSPQIYVNDAWISFEREPIEPLARDWSAKRKLDGSSTMVSAPK